MGVCSSNEDAPGDRSTVYRDQETKSPSTTKRVCKLLLLGAGGSGKSTLLKQMDIRFNKGKMVGERHAEFASGMRRFAVKCMQTTAKYCIQAGLLKEGNADVEIVLKAADDGSDYSAEIGGAIASLWNIEAVEKTWRENRYQPKFWTLDEAPYYFKHAKRIADENFQITSQDMLRSRTKTTGIQELTFSDGEMEYRVIDVGGQRSERRKWIQCFEDVDIVCFISSLAGFASVLYEDENENRLNESLKVFEQVVNQPCFVTTPFFVWFTKVDLFADLVKNVDISTQFSDYTGPKNDELAALNWHRKKFRDVQSAKHPNKILRFADVNVLEGGSVARAFDQIKLFT